MLLGFKLMLLACYLNLIGSALKLLACYLMPIELEMIFATETQKAL